MKINGKTLVSFTGIVLGILAFLGFNLCYALLTIHGFSTREKGILLVTPSLLFLIFLAIAISSAKSKPQATARIKHMMFHLLAAALGGWLLLITAICFLQYHALYTNSIPRKETYLQIQQQPDRYETISITTPDHIQLQGFLSKKASAGKSPLVLYFGGRGEEASDIVQYAAKIEGCSLTFINYRGCGSSGGKQEEKKFFSDAIAIYDYFAGREDVDAKKVVLAAHSLGTGVAVHLASERTVKGVVLSAPYDVYAAGVIQDKLPLVPAALLSTGTFDSLSLAPGIGAPALFLLAEKDRTVLRSRSLRLFDRWKGNARTVVIPGTHHENITKNEVTWEHINAFLRECFDVPG